MPKHLSYENLSKSELVVIIKNLINENIKIESYLIDYQYDELTGFRGRKDHSKCLLEAIRNLHKHGSKFIYGMVDINGLHDINRDLGIKAGDLLICETSDYLRDKFPYSDVFRIGGDEFAILISSDNIKTNAKLLSKVPNTEYGCVCCYDQDTDLVPDDVIKIVDNIIVNKKLTNKTGRGSEK